jgi:hypothetical protein
MLLEGWSTAQVIEYLLQGQSPEFKTVAAKKKLLDSQESGRERKMAGI